MSYNKKVYRRYSGTRNGGKSAASLVNSGSELIYWALFVVLAFVCFWVYKKLFNSTAAQDVINNHEKEILNHSKDRMRNGSSYIDGAKWIFDELYHPNDIFPWWKPTDHDSVGRYMLTIQKAEFQQLEATYKIYKKEHLSWYQYNDNDSLRTDLVKLFSSSERVKYLSHLGLV